MAIAVTATKNALANTYAAQGTWISLHTADPTSTGGSEANGAPYARKQTTWGSASGGVVTGSQVAIDAPAATYTYAGIWTAQTGGTFIDKVQIQSTTLGSTGQVLVTPTYTQS